MGRVTTLSARLIAESAPHSVEDAVDAHALAIGRRLADVPLERHHEWLDRIGKAIAKAIVEGLQQPKPGETVN